MLLAPMPRSTGREIIAYYTRLYTQGRYVELCEEFCHEGLGLQKILFFPEDVDDPRDAVIELGICSFSASFPSAVLPDDMRDMRDFFEPEAVQHWPQEAKDALKKVADYCIEQAKLHGVRGC